MNISLLDYAKKAIKEAPRNTGNIKKESELAKKVDVFLQDVASVDVYEYIYKRTFGNRGLYLIGATFTVVKNGKSVKFSVEANARPMTKQQQLFQSRCEIIERMITEWRKDWSRRCL